MRISFSYCGNTTRKVLVLTIGLLLALSSLARGRPIDAKELYGAMSPAWSPDGRRIAYVIQHQDRQDLFLIDAAGSTPTKLAENAGDPAWSPDGQAIAYTGFDQGNETIWIMNLQTRESRQLTIGYNPQWSPDGKHLAYLVAQTLEMANGDGSAPRRPITDGAHNVWGFWWSPDSSQLAFISQGQADNAPMELYVSKPDGSVQHKIADSTDRSAAWSPNGKQLLFAGHCGDTSAANLCVVNPDGSGLHRIAAEEGQQPVWSPHGDQIAFTLNSDVCIINSDGSQQRCVTRTNDPAIDNFAVAWSPNGRELLFTRMHTPQATTSGDFYVFYSEVDIINSDGSALRQLPDGVETF